MDTKRRLVLVHLDGADEFVVGWFARVAVEETSVLVVAGIGDDSGAVRGDHVHVGGGGHVDRGPDDIRAWVDGGGEGGFLKYGRGPLHGEDSGRRGEETNLIRGGLRREERENGEDRWGAHVRCMGFFGGVSVVFVNDGAQ